jgi:hypothetical protein
MGRDPLIILLGFCYWLLALSLINYPIGVITAKTVKMCKWIKISYKLV